VALGAIIPNAGRVPRAHSTLVPEIKREVKT
jgi:hypothetical protein